MTNNMEAAREAMFEEARNFGKTEGRGKVARAAWAIRCVELAAEGRANVGDAERIYDEYMGSNEEIQEGFGGSEESRKGNGRKQNVSKFRQFLKLGTSKKFDPVLVAHNLKQIAAEERAKGTTSLSPFDAQLEIVRMQVRGEYADEPLTDEQMRYALQKKVKADKTEADMLDADKRRLEKTNEIYPSAELEESIEALAARIEDLGGTTKQQKERAKIEAAARKKAAKNGGLTTTV